MQTVNGAQITSTSVFAEGAKIYVIEDWAGNTIKEQAKSGLWIAPEFKSFEDGWGYIYEKFPNEEEYEDLYVVEKV